MAGKSLEPLFDTLDSLEHNQAPIPGYVFDNDFAITREFLLAYRDSPDTFNSYRREVERFLQWVYLIAQMKVTQIGREEIENFIGCLTIFGQKSNGTALTLELSVFIGLLSEARQQSRKRIPCGYDPYWVSYFLGSYQHERYL